MLKKGAHCRCANCSNPDDHSAQKLLAKHKSRTAAAYLGIDVGEQSHSACAIDGAGALGIVDQKQNIGAPMPARAFAHGSPCTYMPDYAEKQVRGMFPEIEKTDVINAAAIAKNAHDDPRALAEEPEGTASVTYNISRI